MEKSESGSQIIVVTSGKGGVGKTTSVANICTGLAQLGKKVVILDLDIGLKKLDLIMGLENRVIYDIIQVAEGECTLKQALVKDKRFPNLYMLPAAQTRNKDDLDVEQLHRICDELRQDFEFIILDCPAGIETGFRNSIAVADKAIVVTNPEVSAVRDADRIIGILESNNYQDINLLINRFNPEMVKKGDMLSTEDLLEHLCIKLLGVVPEDKQVLVSTNRGEPIILNERTQAGLAFKNICQRLLSEDVEIMKFEEDNLWSKFKRSLSIGR